MLQQMRYCLSCVQTLLQPNPSMFRIFDAGKEWIQGSRHFQQNLVSPQLRLSVLPLGGTCQAFCDSPRAQTLHSRLFRRKVQQHSTQADALLPELFATVCLQSLPQADGYRWLSFFVKLMPAKSRFKEAATFSRTWCRPSCDCQSCRLAERARRSVIVREHRLCILDFFVARYSSIVPKQMRCCLSCLQLFACNHCHKRMAIDGYRFL